MAAPPSRAGGTHAILRACLTGQESPRAIPISLSSRLWILPQDKLRTSTTPPKVVRIPPPSCLGGLGGLRGARREPQPYQKRGALRSPAEPRRPGGKMTAEVLVMNRSAVALAADSKVTIGGEKTYDTVNKIFTLSKIHPVGVMIFGNADFMHYPWELIVKEYRENKKSKSKPTVLEWSQDFFEFVRSFGSIKASDIEGHLIGIISSTFREQERLAFYQARARNISIPSDDYHKVLIKLLDEKAAEMSSTGGWMTTAQGRTFGNKYWRVVAQTVDTLVASKDKSLRNSAVNLAGSLLYSNEFSPLFSGVVVSGFGEKEILPSMVSYLTDGFVGTRPKIIQGVTRQIDAERPSHISAFAQHDIVDRFMEGIDPGYSEFLQGLISRAIRESNLAVFSKWAPKNKQTAKARASVIRAAQKSFEQARQDGIAYRQDVFTNQILDMLAALPRDEMSFLAESLVALTALHRRIAPDVESVGGPVDVAVISKGDGFIWIKRKHYFKPELNPQFGLNYMRGI
jgi:hypothetical protein